MLGRVAEGGVFAIDLDDGAVAEAVLVVVELDAGAGVGGIELVGGEGHGVGVVDVFSSLVEDQLDEITALIDIANIAAAVDLGASGEEDIMDEQPDHADEQDADRD